MGLELSRLQALHSSAMLAVTAVRAPCRAAADDELVNSIMEAARHPLALDAIASITLSPRSAQPFAHLAAAAGAACPACLIYGKEDPWVVPLWGQRQAAICVRAVWHVRYETVVSTHLCRYILQASAAPARRYGILRGAVGLLHLLPA